MKIETLRELYVDQLRDLFDAESRLIKALPEMAKAANSEDLRAAFEEHLEQTRVQADRLKEIFETLGEKPTGKKCAAMVGLIEEGEEVIEGDFDEHVQDAALIAAAQRVEHYEIAAYGTVRTWAELLGESEAASLLEKNLDEEKETDEKLTELAQEINVEAESSMEAEPIRQPQNTKAKSARSSRN